MNILEKQQKSYVQGLLDGELLMLTNLKASMIEANKSNISIEKFIGILEAFIKGDFLIKNEK